MYQFDRVGVAQISISIIVVSEERTGQGNEEGEQQFYTRPSFGLQDRFVKAGSCNLNSMGLTQLRSRSKAESICVERVELGPTAVGETPNRRTPLESSYRVTPRGQEREEMSGHQMDEAATSPSPELPLLRPSRNSVSSGCSPSPSPPASARRSRVAALIGRLARRRGPSMLLMRETAVLQLERRRGDACNILHLGRDGRLFSIISLL
jgi:hypothetical protein